MPLEEFGDINELLRLRDKNGDWIDNVDGLFGFEGEELLGGNGAEGCVGAEVEGEMNVGVVNVDGVPPRDFGGEDFNMNDDSEGPAQHSFGTGFVVNEEGQNDFRIVSPTDEAGQGGKKIEVNKVPTGQRGEYELEGSENSDRSSAMKTSSEVVEDCNIFGDEEDEGSGSVESKGSNDSKSEKSSQDTNESESENEMVEEGNFDEDETWKVINFYACQSRLDEVN
eukprot:gnl/Chilomastix_caulleri/1991.p1 GENE.gnl/Chilomastix_caulleri/1991~~gnl/Chilomastix_caulleri/1991.p1  ORF type:complete len:242 (-),score=103.38 gnl/Chilomastix_caulleri/1991:74-748(-)